MKFIYAIWDKKAEAFFGTHLPIFTNDSVASRWFADACRSTETAMHAHPEDYELVRVMEHKDDLTGTVRVLTAQQVRDLDNQEQPELWAMQRDTPELEKRISTFEKNRIRDNPMPHGIINGAAPEGLKL